MTVTLEMRSEELATLKERAKADGVDVETFLRGLVLQAVTPSPEARGQREKLELTEKQKGAIALMQAWREEDQTDDPEEMAQRDRDLEEFKANMNRWRTEEGRSPVYP